MQELFSLNNFNMFEDDEYFYVFRALNNEDNNDIELGLTVENDSVVRIRTDRQRYEETRKSKYDGSGISLNEVYDHIKIHHLKNTDCISLSSNANVSLDYGKEYHEQYAMVKVPKKDFGSVYIAGKYMMDEIKKIIDIEFSKLSDDSDEKNILLEIDSLVSSDEIKDIVNKYILSNRNKKDISDRFLSKQYFTLEQQLEYDRLIAKMSILELSGIKPSILESTLDNSSLLATIGNAFSSLELVHYGEITSDEFVMVSPRMMSILALLQQVKEEFDTDNLKEIETKLLTYVREGYDIKTIDGMLYFANDENVISLNLPASIIEHGNNDLYDISVEEAFKLTKGRIRYEKVLESVSFIRNLNRSRLNAMGYAKIVESIVTDEKYRTEISKLSHVYDIDSSIIVRQNNVGKKISESVSLGMNKDGRHFFSDKEQLSIIDLVENLSYEERIAILQGNLNVMFFLENFVDKENEISENEYYVEAIVESLDFNKIYKNSLYPRTLSVDDKFRICNKLYVGDCKNLYNAFLNAGVDRKKISNYIINLYLEGGYKGFKFDELSRDPNLFDIISKNIDNLNYNISAVEFDKMLDIEDDKNDIEGTYISLRDYQYQTVQNINALYESGKRFAGVVLPTGAGKSFVAMTEMLNYSNGNIVYFAPNTEILNQIQRHIVRSIICYGKTDKEKEEILRDPARYSEFIKQKFPHLSLYCYQGLSRKEEEEIEKMDADLIILDEIHRTGAETWNEGIVKLIKKNVNSKILGLSATPERDVDNRDMMREIAELSGDYSNRELLFERYLAINMTVLDGMKEEIVVSPDIVAFDYNLEDSLEYKDIKQTYEKEKDPEKKRQLGGIYQEMRSIVTKSKIKGLKGIINENIRKKDGKYIVFLPNNTDEKLTTEEYMQQQIEVIKDYFKDIDDAPEIGYLISNRKNPKDNSTAIQNFENSKTSHLKLILAINMLNEGVHVDGIDGLVMLRPISDNSTILYLQQLGRSIYSIDPNNPIKPEDVPIVFDVYNNYLILDMDRKANRTVSVSDLERFKGVLYWIEKHGFIPDINSSNLAEARKAKFLKLLKIKYEKYLVEEFGKNITEKSKNEIRQILDLGKIINLWNFDIPERTVDDKEREIGKVRTFEVKGSQKRFMELVKDARKMNRGKMSEKLEINTTIAILDVLSEYGYEINNSSIKFDWKLRDVLLNAPVEAVQLIDEMGFSEDLEIGKMYNRVKEKFATSKTLSKKNPFEEMDLNKLIQLGILEPFASNGDVTSMCHIVSKDNFIVMGPTIYLKKNIYTLNEYDVDGYNVDGYDRYGFNRMGFTESGATHNHRGFNFKGINKNTGSTLDVYGFDRDGFYWKEIEGKLVNTNSKLNDKKFNCSGFYNYTFSQYDDDGYDIDGCDQRGFNALGIHKETQTEYDWSGFNVAGVHKNGTLYNDSGYDVAGFNQYGFNRRGENKNGTKYDDAGFNFAGFNQYGFNRRGKMFSDLVLDSEGFNEFGFNKYGFNKDGIHYNGTLFDNNGFNKDGLAQRKRNDGKTVLFKINKYGFSRDGFYYKQENGRYIKTTLKIDKYGFDVDGYSSKNKPYNSRGFDRDGFYWKEDNGQMVKTKGKVDKYGFTLSGKFPKISEDGKLIYLKVDDYGFDCDGYYVVDSDEKKSKYDLKGFDRNGIHKSTLQLYDKLGFDRDGFYWKEDNGEVCKTTRKYNDEFFDRDGYYWRELDDGERVKTNSLYDSYGYDVNGLNRRMFNRKGEYKNYEGVFYNNFGFDCNGIHKDTGKFYDERLFVQSEANNYGAIVNLLTGCSYDIRGFDFDAKTVKPKFGYIDGKLKSCVTKNDFMFIDQKRNNDANGFDAFGIHRKTGTKYNINGYNAFGVNSEGKMVNGAIHPDIIFVQRYVDLVRNNENPFNNDYINDYISIKLRDVDYQVESHQLVDILMYAAGEMYSPIKQEIAEVGERLANIKKIVSNEYEVTVANRGELDHMLQEFDFLSGAGSVKKSHN